MKPSALLLAVPMMLLLAPTGASAAEPMLGAHLEPASLTWTGQPLTTKVTNLGNVPARLTLTHPDTLTATASRTVLPVGKSATVTLTPTGDPVSADVTILLTMAGGLGVGPGQDASGLALVLPVTPPTLVRSPDWGTPLLILSLGLLALGLVTLRLVTERKA